MYIKKIALKNIKTFKDLNFDFTRPDGSFAGWTVFVGGNGSGKSSILRAIALTMIGPNTPGRIDGWISDGQSEGSAVATIHWDAEHDEFKPLQDLPDERFPDGDFDAGVQWTREEHEHLPHFLRSTCVLGQKQTSHAPKQGPWRGHTRGWFAAGYGPMRRLSGNSEDAAYISEINGKGSRFITLFVEGASLGESEEWLRWMHARSLETERSDLVEIEALVNGVKALLSDGLLPHGITISRLTVDKVYVTDGKGVELPLDDVSDGCRAIFATVIDVVLKLYETYGDRLVIDVDGQGRTVISLPGVILIDEAEAHLHPAWQRDLPEWFKKHFPNIQFLVSTHSPLIAQAADPNGLFILPAQSDYQSEPRQASPAEYEKVRLGAAFKTVLGVAFGLDSTRSRWASEQIARWELLDAKRKAGVLTREEVGEHELLRGRMKVAFPEISSFADM